MSLEAKLAKGAKKSMAREKEKKGKKESHARIEKHEGGYLVETHDHSEPYGSCGSGCKSSVHKSMASASKVMKEHFGEGAEKMGEKDEDEGELEQ